MADTATEAVSSEPDSSTSSARDLTFRPVGTMMPHRELEDEIRRFWRERDIFRRTVDERPADDVYSFYEGPPTANGTPGVHHVLSRVFKDLFPRYQTMRGKRVPRKGGWDTHGLPVEIEVEKTLGLDSKPAIEEYGIAEFNRHCRESVMQYVQQWEDMTERVAFWIDMSDAYRTYTPEYVESCWWIFKTLWDAGLIYEARRTTPHCPRCESSLSSHELSQGMQDGVRDQAVTVRFRAHNDSLPDSLRSEGTTDFLAWTTTPWTLPANSGLALNANESYALVEIAPGERLILARKLVGAALDGVVDQATVIGTVQGAELVGVTYDGLYEPDQWGVPMYRFDGARLVEWTEADGRLPARSVAAGDFVEMESGTGIVHIAPAFGEDDYQLGREVGLLFRQPVDLSGRIVGNADDPAAPAFVGKWVKDADPIVMDDLEARGLLLRKDIYEHTYPYCWRCDTPLLYYAKPSWYIATSQAKDLLTSSNAELISWHPEHTGTGRYGDWLANNVDWAVSRERYWGTPLPFWRCTECGDVSCVGSFDELRERARAFSGVEPDLSDPHRPYVDEIEIGCDKCPGAARRCPEVADAWFDSGAMPYAQWHYPFENQDRFDERFPADFICEAVDQTRGWFYSLHAEAAMLHRAEAVPEPISFRNVISLGHILDEAGEKMSKSKGNVVDPWEVLDQSGADALRWYCYVASPAGNPRRFSPRLVSEAQRRFLHTLWNTYSFFITYANIDGWRPTARTGAPTVELDRWILSELHSLIGRVTEALDDYDPTTAAREIDGFVDSLSNWYVRRSRRRFWSSARGGAAADLGAKQSAYLTLYEVLTTLARLLAPMTPYLSEEMWRNLVAELDANAPESVHLARWPEVDASLIDESLNQDMALVQRVASLGRAARSAAGLKVRQPLAAVSVAVRSARDADAVQRLRNTIAEELNVKSVTLADAASDSRRYTIKPNLRTLGPRIGPKLPALRAALSDLPPELASHIAQAAESGQTIEVEGVELEPADLLIEVDTEAAASAASAEDERCSVQLSTELTAELIAEGKAREVINRVQGLRRDSGLNPDDRIQLRMASEDDELRSALATFESLIAAETLATSISVDAERLPESQNLAEADIDGAGVVLSLERAWQ
ncbi:MAG: isoleucine--tRNA ligase [Chloroflexi bacterium]|nr:isoleucine--tRNA ligase [Chloroflexota bacterium]